jgi:hypothetical protein
MLRADMAHIMRLIENKKFGKHKVPYKDKTINIEIKRTETGIVVKQIRVM